MLAFHDADTDTDTDTDTDSTNTVTILRPTHVSASWNASFTQLKCVCGGGGRCGST